jgi:hypothetical protein
VPSSSGRGLGDGERKKEGFMVVWVRKKTHGGGTMGFRNEIKFGIT